MAKQDPQAPSLLPSTDNSFNAWMMWMREAEAHADIRYHHACTLATVDADGHPDARVVLAHRVNSAGLLFSTGAGSAKARQLQSHPRAAAVFHWPPLERQVRARGKVVEASDIESDFCVAALRGLTSNS